MPVEGAKIVLTREGSAARQEKVSSAKGTFDLLVLDATVNYHIHIEKEHFLPLDETVEPIVSDTLRVTYTLKPEAP